MRSESPATLEDVSGALRACNEAEAPVRFLGGGTKLEWGAPADDVEVEISTTALDRIVEFNPADLTAVVEAGARLEDAQALFAEESQMLAIDPPSGGGATVGGIVATNDSGPRRHRYGAVRDLVVGMSIVLADGTIAKSGGRVIKNVAGYDLAKLFCGSHVTLGMIGRVAVRLHPHPPRNLTVRVESEDHDMLGRATSTLMHLPLEMDCLDAYWADGRGESLARFGGVAPEGRAEAGAAALRKEGIECEIVEDDDPLWTRNREAQRSADGMVVKVSALPGEVSLVLREVRSRNAMAVMRAGLGLAYVSLRGDHSDLIGALDEMRRSLAPRSCVVLDAAEEIRAKVDVWGAVDAGGLAVMRRLKQRFDPQRICNRGIFIGGI